MNKGIPMSMGFDREAALLEEEKCYRCGEDINPEDFRDGISIKEYDISGLCQGCQDRVWNE